MSNAEHNLLNAINDQAATRDAVAALYADALAYLNDVDWRAAHEAIVARWSASGLAYIKNCAWKIAANKRVQA